MMNLSTIGRFSPNQTHENYLFISPLTHSLHFIRRVHFIAGILFTIMCFFASVCFKFRQIFAILYLHNFNYTSADTVYQLNHTERFSYFHFGLEKVLLNFWEVRSRKCMNTWTVNRFNEKKHNEFDSFKIFIASKSVRQTLNSFLSLFRSPNKQQCWLRGRNFTDNRFQRIHSLPGSVW